MVSHQITKSAINQYCLPYIIHTTTILRITIESLQLVIGFLNHTHTNQLVSHLRFLNKKVLQNSFKACCPVLRDSRTAPAGSGTGRWWTLERTMVLTPGTAVGTWSRLRASPAPAVTRSSHTLTFNYFGKNRNCPWFSPGAVCRARLSVTRYVYISNISCILVLLIWLLHYLLVETSEDTWQIYVAYHVSKHPGTTRVPFFAPHYTCLSALHVSHTTSHYCVLCSPIVQMQLACHQPELHCSFL